MTFPIIHLTRKNQFSLTNPRRYMGPPGPPGSSGEPGPPGIPGEPGPASPIVGVDYFMTGLDFLETTYLSRYHLPGIRDLVRSQLALMASEGTQVLRTPMWFVGGGPSDPEAWYIGFPPFEQQQINLVDLGNDVVETGMRWEMSFGWLGCADLSPVTVPCGLTLEQQMTGIENTLDLVLGLFSSAGLHPFRAYLYMEVSLAPIRMETFLVRMWPRFRTLCQGINSIPSLYGHSAAPAVAVYEFMTSESLVLPDRAEMSLYLAGFFDGAYAPLADLATVTAEINLLRTSGIDRIAIAETFYPIDAAERRSWGSKFIQVPALEQLMIWPGTADPRYTSIPPYDLSFYGRP